MPNCSSSSVTTVDWAMGVDGCHTIKKRNLLENLSPTPTPPPFQDFISLVNTKQRTHTRFSVGHEAMFAFSHQTPSPQLDHTNCQYAKIRARPLYNFNYTETSIWTQSPSDNLLLDPNMMKKFFAKEIHPINPHPSRSRTTSLSNTSTRPFQILNPSFQMGYDVTMRHLLHLLTKANDQHATIDDVLHGIDRGDINHEWLQCVQRLNKMLQKQFLKHPEDKIKLQTHSLININQLNLVEQYFLKLLHLPNSNFKLKSYQFRDEYQPQLNFFEQSITRLLNSIHSILIDPYLPKIFQLLCFLYNSLSNKCVPGLDFYSLVDALNSPTNQSKKTVAHVLAQILYQYHRDVLLKTINNEFFMELKTVRTMKYETFYGEIREIYQEYRQLEDEYSLIDNNDQLPAFLPEMLTKTKVQFEKLFQQENLLKQGEQNLDVYFCCRDLSVDICLSSIGQFVDKLRLAHLDNLREENQLFPVIDYQRKRARSLQINCESLVLPCHCL